MSDLDRCDWLEGPWLPEVDDEVSGAGCQCNTLPRDQHNALRIQRSALSPCGHSARRGRREGSAPTTRHVRHAVGARVHSARTGCAGPASVALSRTFSIARQCPPSTSGRSRCTSPLAGIDGSATAHIPKPWALSDLRGSRVDWKHELRTMAGVVGVGLQAHARRRRRRPASPVWLPTPAPPARPCADWRRPTPLPPRLPARRPRPPPGRLPGSSRAGGHSHTACWQK